MSSKMLIDAAHPEETRVAVVRGNRLEEFDYESATRKQLKGNIYLARVTRVEPSLQAAFVDYGGNRHGFLAFNEIHPDYYQIPVADRQALLEEEAEEESRAMAEEVAFDDESSGRSRRGRRSRKKSQPEAATDDAEELAGPSDETDQKESENSPEGEVLEASELSETITEDATPADDENGEESQANGKDAANGSNVESVGQEDALEELPVRRSRRRRSYKIQEVIKRRQIILVQVVKEERGNKGAALTTYISLAGRYTVLMPNTARGGGISRKITNATDRKRLRKIAGDLDVASGMGLIIRTAGASRTKAEIKRDFEYLLRMWENIRDLTLSSTAPALVYEEGNLIKRSIRDLYGKEIDSVMVSGENAHKEAKGFMKLLMPSHAKNVQKYEDPQPIFVKHQIERHLAAMFSPQVTLRSGGYIVINQTEALVSVDVNSGRSTREHSIEDTALRTNLEAAEELARQLRLRDLAGLIVIDFIDMEERRNNRSVERRLKDALKHDRARIQVGRISPFGLLEMSRQRLRAGMLEGTTSECAVCQGTGIVRSTESVALDILRSLEDTLMSDGKANLVATASADAALYILNHKRSSIHDIEVRYGIVVTIAANNDFHGANFTIERGARISGDQGDEAAAVHMDGTHHTETEGDEEGGRKRRRRRRRRSGQGDRNSQGERYEADSSQGDESEENISEESSASDNSENREASDGVEGTRRPRRRGRRGGRRTRGGRGRNVEGQSVEEANSENSEAAAPESETATPGIDAPVEKAAEATAAAETAEPKEKPKRTRAKAAPKAKKSDPGEDEQKEEKPAKKATRSRKKADDSPDDKKKSKPKAAAKKGKAPDETAESNSNKSLDSEANGSGEAKPAKRASRSKAEPKKPPVEATEEKAETGERKRGWWQRGS